MRRWAASGTWSHDDPPTGFDRYVLKTATEAARAPNTPPEWRTLPERTIINNIGVRNPGLEATLKNLPEVDGELVVSVLGAGTPSWHQLALRADEANVPVVEMNLSCPNYGLQDWSGIDIRLVVELFRKTYKGELGAKLSPTVSLGMARACWESGVDYLCLSNSLPIDGGGLSGAAIRPLVLNRIAAIQPHCPVPIVGGGGIFTPEHEDAFMAVGATDISQGSALVFAGQAPQGAYADMKTDRTPR